MFSFNRIIALSCLSLVFTILFRMCKLKTLLYHVCLFSPGCHKIDKTYIESSHNLTNNGIRECAAVCNKRGYIEFGLKVIFNYTNLMCYRLYLHI